MDKRILADQGSTLVDLCKVREASALNCFADLKPIANAPLL